MPFGLSNRDSDLSARNVNKNRYKDLLDIPATAVESPESSKSWSQLLALRQYRDEWRSCLEWASDWTRKYLSWDDDLNGPEDDPQKMVYQTLPAEEVAEKVRQIKGWKNSMLTSDDVLDRTSVKRGKVENTSLKDAEFVLA